MMQPSPNDAQIASWNTTAGISWARFQEQLDRQNSPFGLTAIDALDPRPGERILDIGCGCGQTTLQLAERVGPAGHVTGVDVSAAMLAVARTRAAANPTIAFLEQDAQTADLGTEEYDAAYSRLGVMFFADPAAAFANIRRALKPAARIAFACWRSPEENIWMRAPFDSVLPLLPPQPLFDPAAPGPFAFANPDRPRSILRDAGFTNIHLTPHDVRVGGADLAQTTELMLHIGPLGAAMREHPHLRAQAAERVRAILEPFLTPSGVMMPAALWIVTASA